MPRLSLIISSILLLALTGAAVSLNAQGTEEVNVSQTADACREAIDELIAREHIIFRTALLGRRVGTGASIGAVRYDDTGNAWYKVENTKKNTIGTEFPGLDYWIKVGEEATEPEWKSDLEVDDLSAPGEPLDEEEWQMLHDSISQEQGGIDFPRRGILNTKRVLTSDLIPYITQSFRALQCRLEMVCSLVYESTNLTSTEPQESLIEVPGCIPVSWPSIPECQITEGGAVVFEADINQYCDLVTGELIGREMEIVKMLVEYDASYRSLLQFAGIMDEFLLEFRWTLGASTRRAAAIIGWLHRIPCFLSSCDDYPENLDPADYFPFDHFRPLPETE